MVAPGDRPRTDADRRAGRGGAARTRRVLPSGPGSALHRARNGGATGRSAGSDYRGDSVRQFNNTPGMTDRFLAWDDERQARKADENSNFQNPSPTNNYNGGGGRGRGGGGGGGGAAAAAKFKGYYEQIIKALSQMPGQGPDTMTPRINTAVDADLASARGAYGNVNEATSNPYLDFQAQATQVDPGTAAMMQAQGMGGEAALAQQQQAQHGLNTMADLWSNYGQAQAADQTAANDRFNSGIQSDLAGVEADLGGQRSALLAASGAQREQDKKAYEMKKFEAMLQLLGTGYQSGVDISGYDFGGVLG